MAAGFETLPAAEIMALAVGVSVSGLVAGFVAGLLGVGGGIVLVPVLYQVLAVLGVDDSVRMPLAVGTSLATIIPTSIRSTLSHHNAGKVDWVMLRALAWPTVAGVALGAVFAALAGGKGLTGVFAVGAGLLGLWMLLAHQDFRLADALPGGWRGALIGIVNGGLSVMMGIGGGTFGVIAMTLCGVPIHRAVATAAGFGFIIALPGTAAMILNGWHAGQLPPLSLGYVNLVGLALIVPATMLSTPWGVAAAHRLSREALRRIFGIFLCLTSLRMLAAWLGVS